MAERNSGNGRVTNAILGTKLDALIDKVDEYHKDHDELEGRVRNTENELTRLNERMGIFAIAQTALSAALAVVAGWFGSQK